MARIHDMEYVRGDDPLRNGVGCNAASMVDGLSVLHGTPALLSNHADEDGTLRRPLSPIFIDPVEIRQPKMGRAIVSLSSIVCGATGNGERTLVRSDAVRALSIRNLQCSIAGVSRDILRPLLCFFFQSSFDSLLSDKFAQAIHELPL